MIVIVDYNMGNLGSIYNMIKYLGYESKINSNIEEIKYASKLILPGVGSFDRGINNLKSLKIKEVLDKKVLIDRVPILGICLGMQLMTMSSEEGELSGLKWIKAKTKKFIFNNMNSYKVPHMGWNTIDIKRGSNLFRGMENKENRFYFVHSYYVSEIDKNLIIATTEYGIDFVSAFEKDNIIGVQFHPEKSHKFGMQILKNFIENY